MSNYYHMCRQGVGRAVEIRTHHGMVHRGIIDRVTPHAVFLRPFGPPHRGGYGYGGYGYGGYGLGWWGFGLGFAAGAIAIGTIAFLAFLPFFW